MPKVMVLRVGEAGILKPGVNVQFCGETRQRDGVWHTYSVIRVNRNGGYVGSDFIDVCVHPAGGKKISDRQARAQAKRIVAAQRGRR